MPLSAVKFEGFVMFFLRTVVRKVFCLIKILARGEALIVYLLIDPDTIVFALAKL